MNTYIKHIQNKSTHERRQHALQIASAVTGIIFVGWVATLGVRIGNHQAPVTSDANPSQETQLANVINGVSPISNSDNSLEVATTSPYVGQ